MASSYVGKEKGAMVYCSRERSYGREDLRKPELREPEERCGESRVDWSCSSESLDSRCSQACERPIEPEGHQVVSKHYTVDPDDRDNVSEVKKASSHDKTC